MAKDKNRGNFGSTKGEVVGGADPVVDGVQSTDQGGGGTVVGEQAAVAEVSVNRTIVYRRDHPGNRCSYGIAGNSGIVVFDKGLFADGVAPPSIELDCAMVAPKVDNKEAKEQAAAQKLIDKAEAAKVKIEAAKVKAAERQAKADKALADAKAKVEAAAKALAGATPAAPVEEAKAE